MSNPINTIRFRNIFRRLKRVKLLPKLFILTVSLILLVLIFVSGTIYFFQSQMLLRQADEKALSLAQTLAYTSVTAIQLDDYGTLQNLIDSMIDNPDVLTITIVDTIGKVIAADRPELRGRVLQDSLTLKALITPTYILQKLPAKRNMEMWETAVAIFNLNQRIGTAIIKYSVEDTYAGLLKTIIFIGFVAVILSLILSYYFARSLSDPIKQVVKLANNYGKGDLEATITIKREDEIGHLIQSLNKLSQDLKNMIEEKISNESLIMIGEFAAYIIHDLKNPLSGIHLLADGMHRRLEEKNPLKKYSSEILLATQKLEDFIGKTLDIARWTKIEKQSLKINAIVDAEVKATRYRTVPIRTDYDPQIPAIQGDSQLLSMAIRNLLINAIESVSDQGTVSVKTMRIDRQTIIKVSDTGTGIDPDRLGKIFRPFFSLKNHGHGLGLAMVKKAVILHQGKIEVESEKGVGSEFTIILPDSA